MARIKILDKPEVASLYWQLLRSMTEESGRGALLVATAYVDDQLTKLIEAVLPPGSSNTFKKTLLQSHGPLSNLSSKIDICYAFRLIDKRLHECLHALRKIRNDAAHSATSIELIELNEKLKGVYSLGPGFPDHIRNMASYAMMSDKIELAKKALEEWDVEDAEKIEFLNKSIEENQGTLESQLPHWELVFGLTLLCGFIIYHRDNLTEVIKDVSVWGELSKDESEPNKPG